MDDEMELLWPMVRRTYAVRAWLLREECRHLWREIVRAFKMRGEDG